MDNPKTLATLGTQDTTWRRQTKQKNTWYTFQQEVTKILHYFYRTGHSKLRMQVTGIAWPICRLQHHWKNPVQSKVLNCLKNRQNRKKGLSKYVWVNGSLSHQSSVISERKKFGSDLGQFHYAMINWWTVQWAFVVEKICKPRSLEKVLKYDLFGIFPNVP